MNKSFAMENLICVLLLQLKMLFLGPTKFVLKIHSHYVYSQRTKHNRYIYHSVGFDPDVEQNAVNNNWLLKLKPAVMLQSR